MSKNEGVLAVKTTQGVYSFREPTGRDLVAFDKALKTEELGQIDSMALLASILEVTGSYDVDYFLDLPLSSFRAIADKLNGFFQV
jgi:hypothetical protein